MGLKSKRIYDGVKGFSIKLSVLSLLLISLIPFVNLKSFLITTIYISAFSLFFLIVFIDMHNAFKLQHTQQTNFFFKIARFIYDRIDKFSIPLAKVKGFVREGKYVKVERHPYYNAATAIPHFLFKNFSFKKIIIIILYITSIVTFFI